jgi:transaldolase
MRGRPDLRSLGIKIFADGADLGGIREMRSKPFIRGFTTNPTLMRKAGITDYKAFALQVLDVVTDRPISFEVFADDFGTMERQALEIASWGPNVNVKIPITNTLGESAAPLVGRLSRRGVVVNVTAMFTLDHVRAIVDALDPQTPAILSVFAGRIADTGVDPEPLMREAVAIAAARPQAEVLWASPRELLNIFHADRAGCHIITVTNDLLKKLDGVGKDLDQFSRETVQMFHRDATAAGFEIAVDAEAVLALA